MVKIDVCIPYILVDDAAAMSPSVLSNLWVQLRDDIFKKAETHLREVLERKTCRIFLVELIENNAYGLLGVGPKHELE